MSKNQFYATLFLFLLGSLHTSFAMQAPVQLNCGGDYKLPGQVPQGLAHQDVVRAGVLLCKDYGQDDRITNDRYAVILGHDKNVGHYMPQAGKIEHGDNYTSQTASRELEEETGGLIQISAKTVSALAYLYAGKKQLFILKDDTNANISVNAIKKQCTIAIQTASLPACYKEIDGATAVSVVELMRVAQGIDNGSIPTNSSYTLVNRSQGQAITIEGFYMQMFGHAKDHSRYQRARAMFNAIFGVNIF